MSKTRNKLAVVRTAKPKYQASRTKQGIRVMRTDSGLYCSPQCGGGCTRAQHDAAQAAAERCLARMTTEGWKIKLTHNLGWFWSLEHKTGYLTVSGGQPQSFRDTNRGFYAMLSANEGSGTCDYIWSDSKEFSDPNRAVAHRLKWANDAVKRAAWPIFRLGCWGIK